MFLAQSQTQAHAQQLELEFMFIDIPAIAIPYTFTKPFSDGARPFAYGCSPPPPRTRCLGQG